MRKWYPVILIGGLILFSALVYSHLPARVVTHWGANGQPNGYSSRFVAVLLIPATILFTWGLMRGLPVIDPRRANYAKFQGTYDLIVNAVVTLLAVVQVGVLGSALGWPMPDPRYLAMGTTGVLTLILGNVLPRARSNWWFGIRTPWTLSSETVWTKTHRVGGYMLSAAGVLILLSMFLPPAMGMTVLLVSVVGASLGATVYSYFVWKQEQP